PRPLRLVPLVSLAKPEVRGLDLLRSDLRRAAFQRGVALEQALQARREPQRARVGDQRPADGDRLLLAAGQLRRALVPAVLHPAEQLVDALDRPRPLARVGGADLGSEE